MPKVSDVPQRILKYISDFNEEHGFSPTIREICSGIGISSSSTVHRHIHRMKEKGILIETKPGCPRSLAISSNVLLEEHVIETKHLCLQTSDGGILILDCRANNGRLEFNGPIKARGLNGAIAEVISCRELDEEAYYEAMVL